MSLLALQEDWQAGLADEDRPAPAALAGPEPERRFGVYRNAYRARLIQALGEAFDRTWSWLGDEAFHAAALTYVQARPPVSRSLNDFGDGFAEHLAYRLNEAPETGELAWLDWSLRRAFDGEDAAPLTPADLAGLTAEAWDRVRLRPVPTMALRPLATNAPALWSALAAERDPPQPGPAEPGAWLLVWRKGLQPQFRTLSADEAEALAYLRDEGRFAGLCELLARTLDPAEAVARAGSWLGAWMQDELIAAPDFGEASPL